jgi:hypothetical protein
MGCLVAMSDNKKFKLTTVQREVWFFTKIILAVTLSFFGIAMLIWGAGMAQDQSSRLLNSEQRHYQFNRMLDGFCSSDDYAIFGTNCKCDIQGLSLCCLVTDCCQVHG